jgi:hypothetical protein
MFKKSKRVNSIENVGAKSIKQLRIVVTTLNRMMLRIKTVSIMTLSIATLSKMTLSKVMLIMTLAK